MSTCPMAALGPPRNPPDTDTWSGSDKSATNQCQLSQRPHQALQEIPQIPTHGVGVTNRPPTNVNLPKGRIRPSKKSPNTDTWSGSDKSATNQCQLAQWPH